MKTYFTIGLILYIINYSQSQTQKEWVLSLGGNQSDNSVKIYHDNYENIYILGYFNAPISIDQFGQNISLTPKGSSDIFLIKYNSSHQLIWAKSFGGTGIDRSKDIKIKDNYLIITGFFSQTVDFDMESGTYFLTSNGNYDIFLAKYTLDGEIIWAKSFGGTGPDIGRALWIMENHDIILTGDFNSTVDFDPSDNVANFTTISPSGVTDVFIAKYNANGQYLWAKQIAGNSYTYSYSINLDTAKNIYIIGTFSKTVDFDPSPNTFTITATGSSSDIYLAKYTDNGNFVWVRTFGGTQNDFVSEFLINKDQIYLIGHFQNTVDFDPSPNVLSKTSYGLHDIFLSKFNTDGNFIWVKTFGSTGSDLGTYCALDTSDNIFIAGGFSGTVDFDPSSNVQQLNSSGSYDSYIAQYNPDGNLLFLDKLSSTSDDRVVSLYIYNNIIYLLGGYSGTLNFDISPYSYTSSGQQDCYVAKYRICYAQTYHQLATINQYQTYYFNGQHLNTSGIYYDTLPDKYGCDSIVVLHLTVNELPLPVELLSFNVICTQTGALITWTTASEINNHYFTVEKSTDLVVWKVLSTISGMIFSNEINNYAVEDKNILSDQYTYYRLKQTDIDGKYRYYDVYSVLCNLPNDKLEIIGISANQNSLSILVQTLGFLPLTIELYDLYGKKIYEEKYSPTKGINIININQINISSNIYFLSVIQSGKKITKKIIFQ